MASGTSRPSATTDQPQPGDDRRAHLSPATSQPQPLDDRRAHLSLAIDLPHLGAAPLPDRDGLASFIRAAEDAGIEQAWTLEAQLGSHNALDALSTLAFAAGLTSQMRLGLGVAILAMHQPLRLARAAMSIDRLSGGRLTLGVGIGGRGLPFQAVGAQASERVSRFEESVDVMRALWTQPSVDRKGRFLALSGAAMEPKPLQQPLPLWFGGGARRALARASRLADGWLGSGSSSLQDFRAQLAQLREELMLAGRDPTSFPVGKRAYIAIDQPQALVADFFKAVYHSAPPGRDTLFAGEAGHVAERLRGLADAGAQTLLINCIGDARAQLDALTERVIAEVRS